MEEEIVSIWIQYSEKEVQLTIPRSSTVSHLRGIIFAQRMFAFHLTTVQTDLILSYKGSTLNPRTILDELNVQNGDSIQMEVKMVEKGNIA